jgi:hypothetical protein
MNRSGPTTEHRPSRRVAPFWMLQLGEFLAVFALIDIAAHINRGRLLVVAGAAVAALALTAKGPFGVVRVCGRKLHAWLVTMAGVVIALAPILPGWRPGLQGLVVIEFAAVGLVRLSTLTRLDQVQPQRSHRSGTVPGTNRPYGSADVIDATATVSDGRRAAPSATTHSVDVAARLAGRATAITRTVAARSAARHRPNVEAHVKRTLRGAGRIAGRAAARTGRSDPQPD